MEGAVKNRNGIEIVPPPRPKRDCINPATGRMKRTFYARMQAEQYLATAHSILRDNVRIYECSGGHFHITRQSREGKFITESTDQSDALVRAITNAVDEP